MRRASQCGLDWIDTRAFVGFLNQSWANLHNCQTFMKLPESSLPGEEMARVRIKRGRSGGKRKKGEKKGEKGRSGGKGQEWGKRKKGEKRGEMGRSGGKEEKGRKKGEMREIREGVGKKEKRGKWAGVGEKEKKEEKRGKWEKLGKGEDFVKRLPIKRSQKNLFCHLADWIKCFLLLSS